MKAALLLSGGMDSIAIAYWLRPEAAITVDYGQRPARGEIRAARGAAEVLDVEHHVITVDLSTLGSGDMGGSRPLSMAPIPEWWPFRNQMLVTLGAMKGIGLGIDRLIIGSLLTDGGHSDGRAAFVEGLSALLRQQEGGMTLTAPAIDMTATELIRRSSVPMEILAGAHSCHVGEYACGLCRGCRKHYETMTELGQDPY